MKGLVGLLIALLVGLQTSLWFGDGSLPSAWRLKQDVNAQREVNQQLIDRNSVLRAEVVDLKHGYEAIEERARVELGMVKKGEVFYQIVE